MPPETKTGLNIGVDCLLGVSVKSDGRAPEQRGRRFDGDLINRGLNHDGGELRLLSLLKTLQDVDACCRR